MTFDTLLELRAYINEHIAAGRGDHAPVIDQRGLGFLQPKHHHRVGLSAPPEGHTHTADRVFLRAAF